MVWAMLESLRIRNLAVIEDITWEPGAGMNVITGETGAGKSILIDALMLLLGERADKSLIREGAESAVVEAVFRIGDEWGPRLEELGLESSGEERLYLKRQVANGGQNRQFVNGSPCTLQNLKQLGEELVDFHGPHDHQSLLKPEAQLEALDAFAKAGEALSQYRKIYQTWQKARHDLETLKESGQGDWQARLDYLDSQINEIEKADLKPGEEEEIHAGYLAASNARRILELGASVRGLLDESGTDVLGLLSQAQKLVTEWSRLDPKAAPLVEWNEAVVGQVKELLSEVESRMESVELDQERLGQLEARLDTIQTLKRKFGPTLESVEQRLRAMQEEREQLASREGKIGHLEKEVEEGARAVKKAGEALRALRQLAAPKLGRAISRELQELGFKKAAFSIELTALSSASSRGLDQTEFVFAPNPGEPPKSLRAIASSGEMARVMLAVKTVLASGDRVPVLIFDEVDANVGGETSVVVGKKLRGLAGGHQVFCITHLPQVAAAGHQHFSVEKKIRSNRTTAEVALLKADERIGELARMLGGKREASERLAKELLADVMGG
jgi:DNA repair protein RecN (Recombination protein N)